MSMHEIEALVEAAVTFVHRQDRDIAQRRRLAVQLYDLQGLFDCGYTHFRNWDKLLDLGVFSVLPADKLPDPALRAQAQAQLASGKSDWLSAGELRYQAHVQPGPRIPAGVWVEPRLPLWQSAVDAGLIQGLAAEPVPLDPQDLSPAIELLDWMSQAPEHVDGDLIQGWAGFLIMLDLYDMQPDFRQDPRLAPALRKLAALDLPADDYITQRFPRDPDQLAQWEAGAQTIAKARWLKEHLG